MAVPTDRRVYRDTYKLVTNHITDMYPDAISYQLTEKDKAAIQKLADRKYSTWSWNYGYSPKYGLKKGVKTDGGQVEVHLNVYKGVITELDIFGDFFVNRDIEEVKQALIGVEHRQESVLDKLKEIKSSAYFNNISEEELAVAFF